MMGIEIIFLKFREKRFTPVKGIVLYSAGTFLFGRTG
jgi:hypothetical protein